MKYSIEHGLGFGILSLGKNTGKNLRSKYSQKLLRSSQKIFDNYRCTKNNVKKRNSKKAEATGDLIGNKMVDKIARRLSSTYSCDRCR